MNTAVSILICAGCLGIGACTSPQIGPKKTTAVARPAEQKSDSPFGNHPSAAVRNAAGFGGGLVGGLIGIPASVVLIPITYPLASVTKDKWTGLYPFGICYFTGSALFGGAVAPFVPSTYLQTRAPQPQSPNKP